MAASCAARSDSKGESNFAAPTGALPTTTGAAGSGADTTLAAPRTEGARSALVVGALAGATGLSLGAMSGAAGACSAVATLGVGRAGWLTRDGRGSLPTPESAPAPASPIANPMAIHFTQSGMNDLATAAPLAPSPAAPR